MKGRRTLTYNELLADTVKIITMFRADIPLIKKRVDSLIERAYLKRDENSRSTFHYVPWFNYDIYYLNFENLIYAKDLFIF